MTINVPQLFRDTAPGYLQVKLASDLQFGSLITDDGSAIRRPSSSSSFLNSAVFTYAPDSSFFLASADQTERLELQLRIQGEGTSESNVTVLVNIVRWWLQPIPATYRSITDKERIVYLRILTRRGDAVNKESPLLSRVVVTSLPSSGCRLSQFDGWLIQTAGTEVTDKQLRLRFFPPPDRVSCAFEFQAVATNGKSSQAASVTLEPSNGVPDDPRAYNTSATFVLGIDTSRTVELVGSTTNPDTNLSFYVTALPQWGSLFFVDDTFDSLDLRDAIRLTDEPLYSGPNSHIVLIFAMNATVVPLAESTDVRFFVRDDYSRSKVASCTIAFRNSSPPVCSPLIISPVFWDRPVTNVILNYKEVNGFSIQKLILLTAPRNPVGDLYFSRKIAAKDLNIVNAGAVRAAVEQRQLRPGLYFTDKDKRLSYMVRRGNNNVTSTQTYTYRAMNFQGESCIGSVTFEVMPHNQAMPTNALQAVRRELVRVNDITLLPLWGLANLSVKEATSAVIVNLPTRGTLYTVTADAPFDPSEMYRVGGLTKQTYCRRHKCEKYLGEQLVEGSTVEQVRLWSRTDLENSTKRLFVFYKSPQTVESLQTSTDSFDYAFVGKDGTRGKVTQHVEIHFKKAKKRVVEVTYKADSTKRWTTYSEQPETLIKCQVSNLTSQVVAVEEFDMFRRHNKKVDFRLFQFREEGNRLVLAGDRLAKSNKYGLDAQWLLFNNSVVLIPGARSRQQVFKFRARIYNLTATGAIDPNVYEVVRVIVRPTSLEVLAWNLDVSDVNVTLGAGSSRDIQLFADDPQGEALTFRIFRGPRFGVVLSVETRFNETHAEALDTGSVIRHPLGSIYASQVQLRYLAGAHAEWRYPLEDNFAIFARNEVGIVSDLLVVNITVLKSAAVTAGAASIPLQTVPIAAVTVALCAVVVLVVVKVLRPRKLTYMKIGYLPEQGQDSQEMHPVES